ncbi:MAG: PD40 domain-containing protein [Flavobacteriales bacterium]|jgi:outer membrane protein OmpA-like peptidoglycan-associated protein|nr:PD40 domain-containing protein [Flavobacteriales bacterium]MBK6881712.1 PD40 domain-containing protein [Flavobacteriales bacterium]MBK7102637.1 PD40 domain-containing protein [Flavobacteriales bacterium]MBK7113371.1 PD40 domain-containing protein [Flavobacteriales bacterium]MBK7482626.1 PD40 domain-containing protein [Flavobacteriales bacterium]
MRLRSILLIGAVLFGIGMQAQGNADAYINEGDRYFQQMAYARAIDSYTVATELGAVNEHVTKRLAESQMKLGNSQEAERWYAMVVKFLNREPIDLYNYAEALKGNGKYAEAEDWMDRYLATTGEGGRSNINGFARKFSADPDRFIVRPVSINSPVSDFGATWIGTDRVAFSSARNEKVGIERRAAWNDQPFLDMYVATVTPGGDLLDPSLMQGAVNSKFHEGPVSVSASGDVIWFTRNGYFNGRSQRSSSGISRLAIYKAYDQGQGWGNVEQFLYNNSEISVGHPALSPDGKRLYFVSDMPGGYGGTDLYVCRDLGGQWGEPENLGSSINTSRNEVFPFIGANGTLYFSSNGHPGLGGLDVFAAPYLGSDEFSSPMNVGAPVNGTKDDFAFVIDAKEKRGFFSSNRPGGQGDDDIYSFEMLAPLTQRYLVTGLVIDDENASPLIDLEVKLLDKDGALIATAMTDSRGEYSFPVEKNKEYLLRTEMKGRYPGEQHMSTERIEEQQIITRDIHLVPNAGIWLRGTVRNKDRPGFVSGVTVTVVNTSSFFAETFTTEESGDFSIRMQSNEEFEVLLEKSGYYSMSLPISTVGMKEGLIILNDVRDLSFEPIELGVPSAFRFVRWAKDEVRLDPVARTELEAFAERLNVNPAVHVEIGVHSDARDGDGAVALDQRRADAIVDFLVNNGVKRERLVGKGFGTTRLKNHCAPGVVCSEAEHAQNRRVEYTITRVDQ